MQSATFKQMKGLNVKDYDLLIKGAHHYRKIGPISVIRYVGAGPAPLDSKDQQETLVC